MENKTKVSLAGRDYNRVFRRISLHTELFSYALCSPALIVYGLVAFIKTGALLRPFLISTCITVCCTYTAGLILRRVFLAPYAAWILGGEADGPPAEAARSALLALPLREAISLFLRWGMVAPLVLAMAPLFNVDYGLPYAIFSLVSCVLNGLLEMPVLFLGAELIASPLLNSGALARAKARPKRRFSLRFRLGWSIQTVTTYLCGTVFMQMLFLRSGYIGMNDSISCLLLLFAGGISMMVMILGYVARSQSRTLAVINAKLEEMNSDAGDLSARLDVIAQDDIGRLSENFNGLMGFLRSSISAVKASAAQGRALGDELAGTSEEASATATQMAATMEGLRRRSEFLGSSASGQRLSLTQANESLQAFLGKLEEQASAVEESSASIHQTMAHLASIEASTKEKRALMQGLRQDGQAGERGVADIGIAVAEIEASGSRVRDLIKSISDVAAQTKLLAMNASIEAAHAGSAGKGFAVVANEIRKLAASTDRSSADIERSMADIVTKINHSVDLSRKLTAIFEKIQAGITVVDGGMEETLTALTEAAQGSGQIVAAVGELGSLTAGLREDGQLVRERLAVTAGEADRVASLAEQGERSTQEMNDGLSEIAKAASILAELGQRNAATIADLDAETARFRLE